MEVPEMVAKLRRLFALDTDDMEAIAAKLESLAADYDRLRAERDAMAASHARLVAAISKIRRGDFPDSEQPLWDELSTALSLARDLPADGDKEPRP